jgi:UDP-N-acetylglucosamine--N-acetylmuramyl-(pentapeptide) pyrophosphoryl-undecaprenol N-acetylglucosamine transferase
MKIVFTGGGTGGHFYPIIAVAQALQDEIKEQRLLAPQLYFLAPTEYNKGALYNNGIEFKKIQAGKIRRNSGTGFLNFFDLFKTGTGLIKALWTMFMIYPDVVFSKGGYGAFPVVFAARILRIPVVIHESDSAPGKVNEWSGKFAKRIAISYPDAAKYFPREKVAWTGNPIRDEISLKVAEGGHEFLDLDSATQTIFILGGSQGAQKINNIVLDALPELLKKYQIIHQVGAANFEQAKKTANFITQDDERMQARYKIFPYMNDIAMRMSAGVADLVITRAGSALFEIANWEIPAIVIPITESNGNHQRKNAYAYARTGAGVVIEENNLEQTVLLQEVRRILESSQVQQELILGTKEFKKSNAAEDIAEVLLEEIIKHES